MKKKQIQSGVHVLKKPSKLLQRINNSIHFDHKLVRGHKVVQGYAEILSKAKIIKSSDNKLVQDSLKN